MTTFRTDMTPGEVAAILGYKSPRSVVRLSNAGVLPVAWTDARGRRYREIDVLELKMKRDRLGSGGGGQSTSRAGSGLAAAKD